MDLLQVLQGQLSDDLLDNLGQHIGADRQQTATAANDIFAALLGGLANNTASEDGQSALGSALSKHHDGSILDDLMGAVGGMIQQGGQGSGATNGLGILGHILGGQQEAAAEHVSQSSGLNMSQVMKLMPILAPIVMGVLGKTRNSGNVGLGDLAGILMGSAQNAQTQSGLGGLLGNILGGVLGGGAPQQAQQQQPTGGDLLGSVLGSIFKGR